MDKHFTYLLINFLTVFFPIILSFDSKVQFFKSWKYIFPALFISGCVFLVWDWIFTLTGVWSFNADYILGVYFFGLPLEEILFFITVPFACLFIYSCLNYYLKKNILKQVTPGISWFLVVLSVLMLVIYHHRVYTLITFSLLFVLIVYSRFIKKARYLSRFYLAYLVSLLPFYLVNGLLTSIPVVMYNNQQNMNIRIGSIPAEDHFYSLAMILLNIILFEYFKSRPGKSGNGN